MRFYLIDNLKDERRMTYDLFLRLMGFVYFCAFLSCAMQMDGLYGEHGILPVSDYLQELTTSYGDRAFYYCPTLSWFWPSADGLTAFSIAGVVFSVCLMAGFLPSICTFFLYLLYLSLVSVGQQFLSYQWDALLLQVGFVAIAVALLQSAPQARRLRMLTTFVIFWLNFHLIFSSGICKLASGDPTWSDLTALTYHFFTQPLPTPLAIFANATPLPISKFMCLCTLIIEIGCPFFIFAPRVLRFCVALFLAFLQILIALTGNYCFFNLLSLVLLIPLLDDKLLKRIGGIWANIFPVQMKDLAKRAFQKPAECGRGARSSKLAKYVALPFVVLLTYNACYRICGPFVRLFQLDLLMLPYKLCQPFCIDNNYGLFAVMTRERPEIIVEGSDDGVNYKIYQFKYKTSRVDQVPPIVAPLQPRLDWQMWFEGLNALNGDVFDPERGLNPPRSMWFDQFMARLSAADKPVLDLLAVNPFPERPPRYLRARVVNYYFVSPGEMLRTGRWWTTKELGTYYDSKNLLP